MGKRRYFYFVIGIVLLAAFSITGISLLISSPALYVENIKISKEEAEFFVSEEKSASYAYFAGKYNADTSVSSFRNTQFDGITPEEYARERALKNIVETKNILLLAKEAGMAESVSYSDIRKDWKEFVAARKNAVESNEIVYGPVEMSFSDYYSYYISKIKLEMFEQYKVDNRLQESETRQYYESHKELFSQGDEISLLVYSVPDAADGNGESTLRQIKKEIEVNCHNDFDVSWLNDGKMDTRWASANSELPIEIEFNLGSDVTFNTMAMTENIVANWATPRIESFQLQAWDGTTYQTIFENTGEVGERKEFAFEDTTAQKIRLVITALRADTSANSAGQTDPSIAEFELYRR